MRVPIRVGLFLVLLLATRAVAQLQDFTYTNINGTITITGYTGTAAVVTIPSTIDGLPVVTIGNGVESAFYGTNVTSVIIPNTVIDIAAETDRPRSAKRSTVAHERSKASFRPRR